MGVAMAATVLVGCASGSFAAPAATTDGEAAGTSPSPEAISTISPAQIEAQARAEEWIETTPMPAGAIRTDAGSTGATFNSYQDWVCSPTMTASEYWAVPGMSPVEVFNWMLDNPTPGLTATHAQPEPLDAGYENFTRGFLPSVDAQEGVVFTFIAVPDGTALRAESGAMTSDATCPTPPGGGAWGRPGEG